MGFEMSLWSFKSACGDAMSCWSIVKRRRLRRRPSPDSPLRLLSSRWVPHLPPQSLIKDCKASKSWWWIKMERGRPCCEYLLPIYQNPKKSIMVTLYNECIIVHFLSWFLSSDTDSMMEHDMTWLDQVSRPCNLSARPATVLTGARHHDIGDESAIVFLHMSWWWWWWWWWKPWSAEPVTFCVTFETFLKTACFPWLKTQ